jgi:serine/threonine-protein kinase
MQGIGPDTVIDERYRVVRRLGSGGMADVYCAEDQELGRRVALKLLHRRFADDPEFVERFRREASSAAGLQHPNVVGIYDRGEWDGISYIAMELVDGRPLKQLIREEAPLAPERAIDLAEDVLRAARFAHRRGIVHRDLKPHNVLVDQEGRAKVADFGIARAAASDITETGSIMGTAQYLSPEQAQGQPVSPRSDLYSVGIILYEMLTGRVPFEAESPVTIALRQVSERPAPPSQINPAVPPALDAVVMRALEKEPERRFRDADDFIAALEEARRAPARPVREVVLEPTPGEPWAALEEEDRRAGRWWLWLLALLALAALALGAYLLLAAKKRTVPNVIGKHSATASRILQDDGFEVSIQPAQYPDVPRDVVATQSPQPGQRAKEGSTVTLTVSAGPGDAPVPEVTGLPRRQAEDAVHAAGFKSRVQRQFSDQVPTGRVISTSPAPGTTLQKGQTVLLMVSKGREKVAVPDVRGDDRGSAEDALRARGLDPQVTEKETKDAKPGTVLSQDPAAGTQVTKGTTVKLTVAKAPPKVAIPDVTGKSPDDATKALEDAGFKVKQRDRTVTTPDDDGKVVDQRPAAGEKRTKGATVTIFVGKFKPPPPDTTPTPSPTPIATPTV